MGQKVNPTIFKIGVTKHWKYKYFEKRNQDQAHFGFKSLELKEFIEKFLKNKGLIVSNIKLIFQSNQLNILVTYLGKKENRKKKKKRKKLKKKLRYRRVVKKLKRILRKLKRKKIKRRKRKRIRKDLKILRRRQIRKKMKYKNAIFSRAKALNFKRMENFSIWLDNALAVFKVKRKRYLINKRIKRVSINQLRLKANLKSHHKRFKAKLFINSKKPTNKFQTHFLALLNSHFIKLQKNTPSGVREGQTATLYKILKLLFNTKKNKLKHNYQNPISTRLKSNISILFLQAINYLQRGINVYKFSKLLNSRLILTFLIILLNYISAKTKNMLFGTQAKQSLAVQNSFLKNVLKKLSFWDYRFWLTFLEQTSCNRNAINLNKNKLLKTLSKQKKSYRKKLIQTLKPSKKYKRKTKILRTLSKQKKNYRKNSIQTLEPSKNYKERTKFLRTLPKQKKNYRRNSIQTLEPSKNYKERTEFLRTFSKQKKNYRKNLTQPLLKPAKKYKKKTKFLRALWKQKKSYRKNLAQPLKPSKKYKTKTEAYLQWLKSLTFSDDFQSEIFSKNSLSMFPLPFKIRHILFKKLSLINFKIYKKILYRYFLRKKVKIAKRFNERFKRFFAKTVKRKKTKKLFKKTAKKNLFFKSTNRHSNLLKRLLYAVHNFTKGSLKIKLSLKRLDTGQELSHLIKHRRIFLSLKSKKRIKRLRKIRRIIWRLKRDKFYKETFNTMFTVGNNKGTAYILSKYIARHLQMKSRKKRHNYFFRFLKRFLKRFWRKSQFLLSRDGKPQFKTVRIVLRGKFNRSYRGRKRLIVLGKGVQLMRLKSNTDYGTALSYSASGTHGVKVWLQQYRYLNNSFVRSIKPTPKFKKHTQKKRWYKTFKLLRKTYKLRKKAIKQYEAAAKKSSIQKRTKKKTFKTRTKVQ